MLLNIMTMFGMMRVVSSLRKKRTTGMNQFNGKALVLLHRMPAFADIATGMTRVNFMNHNRGEPSGIK